MLKVNSREQLIEALANLDWAEFITIQVGNMSIDLFYDNFEKVVIFDRCEWVFDTLDEVENYICSEYGLQ
ncbi:MAG: hypothetical protein IJA72_00105 [Clostridia bacterium]|nr:hypothetical protein [Clostridia bacterium]